MDVIVTTTLIRKAEMKKYVYNKKLDYSSIQS